MLQRTVKRSALMAALAAAVGVAPAAFAGGTAWNVSIGVPGLAINAGQPGFGGAGYVGVGVGIGYGGIGVGYGGYGTHGHGHRPYYRPYYPVPAARVVVPAPVVYPAPGTYSAPYRYSAPAPYVVPFAPRPYRVVAPIPRRAYAPVLPPPVVVPYRGW